MTPIVDVLKLMLWFAVTSAILVWVIGAYFEDWVRLNGVAWLLVIMIYLGQWLGLISL